MKQKFSWLTDDARTFLSRGYLREGETVEKRVEDIAEAASHYHFGDKEDFKTRFLDYMSRGFFSLSSPIWSNFGRSKGLPISCFGSYVPDTLHGIFETAQEVAMMSKYGGGTSSYWGDVRPRLAEITDNGKSEGSVNFMRLFDTTIDVSKQGTTRRGVHATYLPISHPDIMEFLEIKSDGHHIQNLFTGVCVDDAWFQDMIDGDEAKRTTWAKVLESRSKYGIPYLFFTDNANADTVDVYKDKKLPILASNVCTEIMLPQNEDESFVCCLASLNLEKYDEWKDNPDVIHTLTYFLDYVMSEFIKKAKTLAGMERAVRFAERHRALGIGVVGHFSYLQKHSIPFESEEGRTFNATVYKLIQTHTWEASRTLAKHLGKPELLAEDAYARRNTTLTAIAPTTSSSFILGVSQSIEPPKSNYFIRDLAKVKVVEKNPYLQKVLEAHQMDTETTWESIRKANGSVQHLPFLSDHEKKVFRTFDEVPTHEILTQAAMRGRYIDQGQSVNVMIHPDTPVKDLNNLYVTAWSYGLKSLYYQHSMNAAQEFRRELLECTSCSV